LGITRPKKKKKKGLFILKRSKNVQQKKETQPEREGKHTMKHDPRGGKTAGLKNPAYRRVKVEREKGNSHERRGRKVASYM